MVFIPVFKIAFLVCFIASTLFLNLSSSINSQQALNTTTASICLDYFKLGDKESDLTFEVDCNGAEFGVGLTKENCQDAMLYGIQDVAERTIVSYGDRGDGRFYFSLPQRYISVTKVFSKFTAQKINEDLIGDRRYIVDVALDDIRKTIPCHQFEIALAATFLDA